MNVPRIFVSYEATDVEIATQLITDLRNADAEVMTDNVDLHDTALEQFLSQELPRCQHLVVLQTPAALQSPRMQLVVESALKQVQAGQMREVLRMIAPTPEATKAQEVPPMWAKIPLFDGSQDYPRGFTRLCLHLGINPDDLYNAPLPTLSTPALSLPYPQETGTKSPVAGTPYTLRPGTMNRSSHAHTRVPLRLLVIILSIVISLSIIIAGIGVFSYWGLTASKSAQTTTQTVSPTATLPINAITLSPTTQQQNLPHSDRNIYVGGNLEADLNFGVETSGQQRDWLKLNGDSVRLTYPANQAWGTMYITVGPSVPLGQRPGIDLSDYRLLVVDLRAATDGRCVHIGIKDSNQPDNGTETSIRRCLTTQWSTYTFPLKQFSPTDLSHAYVVFELNIDGPSSVTVDVRNVRYSLK